MNPEVRSLPLRGSRTLIPGIIREIRLKVYSPLPGTLEILKKVLVSLGVPLEELVELDTPTYQILAFYAKSSSRFYTLTQKIKELGLKGVRLEQRILNKKDWINRWKEDFKPFLLGKNFVVVPAYLKGRYSAPLRRTPIYIETAMAFGSGLHETTRFMMQLIEDLKGQFSSFLDIGTGTGILSIMAFHCGASDIHAMDFNPDCIKVSQDNLRQNHVLAASLKVADIDNYSSLKKYDLVVANLVTHHLMSVQKKLVSLILPGQYLAVSGISLENFSSFQRAFRKYPLRTVKIMRGKEWVAVLYKKAGGQICDIRKRKKN